VVRIHLGEHRQRLGARRIQLRRPTRHHQRPCGVAAPVQRQRQHHLRFGLARLEIHRPLGSLQALAQPTLIEQRPRQTIQRRHQPRVDLQCLLIALGGWRPTSLPEQLITAPLVHLGALRRGRRGWGRR
jgi:hypothetical protein